MSTIFVDTDNSNAASKLYKAAKAGKSASAAESLMQKVVKRIIDKTPGFTTTKSDGAKGYAIRLELAEVKPVGHETSCRLSGSIVRYPRDVAQQGKSQGETMVSTAMGGGAKATGPADRAILDCVEAIAESLIPKTIPAMKTDMLKR